MRLRNKLLFVLCIMSSYLCFTMQQLLHFCDPISALGFSSDGHFLVAGFSNGDVAIVDKADTSIRKNIHLYDVPVSAVALDGNDLVIGYHDGTVQLKSLCEQPYAIFKDQSCAITAVAITPLCIITGSSDASVCVRNRVGSLLNKLYVSSGVSAMHISDDACCVLIGCDDGSIWRYNTTCGEFEELIKDLHKGRALCILTCARGFYVAWENAEIIYFDLVDKTAKILKAKYPVYALQLIPEQGVLVCYGGNSIEASDIFDLATGCVYSAARKSGEVLGCVAINRMDIAVVQGMQVYLARVTCKCASCSVQCLTEGVHLKEILLRDREYNLCGHSMNVLQNVNCRVKLFLRACSMVSGVFVEVIDNKDAHYSFCNFDTLMSINKFVIFRDAVQGALTCLYKRVGHTHFNNAYAWHQPALRVIPMDIHTALYSFSFPLVNACLIARVGTEDQRTIPGANINNEGFVWMFDDWISMAPYVLKLLSKEEIQSEEQHEEVEAGQVPAKGAQNKRFVRRVYECSILYLAKQSELFLQRVSGDRLRLTHFDETIDGEKHYECRLRARAQAVH